MVCPKPEYNRFGLCASLMTMAPVSVLEIARRLNVGRLAVYSMLEQGKRFAYRPDPLLRMQGVRCAQNSQ